MRSRPIRHSRCAEDELVVGDSNGGHKGRKVTTTNVVLDGQLAMLCIKGPHETRTVWDGSGWNL